ncbi:S1C family serine protease [Streptomyces antimicrobicus]|uniref:S1C family serine protease n=1 Tax=Streptomyces antimicrobicus TaxID=2883108 RepID=A0ABS8B955_9ACTN|nr:S1C family serine protease [Streptomyces antimicrobicus]MCB5181145.1 S1C family serine protease [Streptomyces antimicrobicus]
MKVRAKGAVGVATAVVLGVTGGGGSAFADDMDPHEIYERSAPATVHVLGKDYSLGSGFIYNPDQGLIATAAHVVQGEATLKVVVGDRQPVPVRVVGIDPCEDLAVLKFTSPQQDLKGLKFGESKGLQAADRVVSLGYPDALGDNPTAAKPAYTGGSVQNPNVQNAVPSSSLPRYPVTVQHSATVNPGNSGGPLLNGKDEVVGINTLTATGGVQGQFYAISSDHARPVLDSLAAGETKNDPGWSLMALDDPELSAQFVEEDQPTVEKLQKRLTDAEVSGVVVVRSLTNSPAYKAELLPGDVVTHLKDAPVASVAEVCDVLQSASPGESLPVTAVVTADDPKGQFKFGDAWTTELVLGKSKGGGG